MHIQNPVTWVLQLLVQLLIMWLWLSNRRCWFVWS